MERVEYYFEISRDNVILLKGTMLYETAWNFALNNVPCSVVRFGLR